MIDKAKFAENYKVFDKEIIKEIIEMYIQEYPDRMVEIRKNIQENDMVHLQRNAHSLKGVTAHFFDPESVAQTIAFEQKCIAEDIPAVNEHLDQIIKSLEKLVIELRVLVNNYS